ncbi:hypothetical protein B0H10DRAFT_2199860 [Mycena sp. CBHHK59/15]|nr:hypothetical protein B0H10DRAFT_2199860 [Mycena sp. CBHHK59/15]
MPSTAPPSRPPSTTRPDPPAPLIQIPDAPATNPRPLGPNSPVRRVTELQSAVAALHPPPRYGPFRTIPPLLPPNPAPSREPTRHMCICARPKSNRAPGAPSTGPALVLYTPAAIAAMTRCLRMRSLIAAAGRTAIHHATACPPRLRSAQSTVTPRHSHCCPRTSTPPAS